MLGLVLRAFQPDRENPSALPTTLGGYARRYLPSYLVGAAFLAGLQLTLNRIDWLWKSIIDLVFAPGAVPGAAVPLIGLTAGLGVLAFGLQLAGRGFLLNAGRDAEYELRGQLLHALHRLGSDFYRAMAPGEIVSRTDGDLAVIRHLMGTSVLGIVSLLFALVSVLQVLLRISLQLTLVSFVTLPALLLLSRAIARRIYVSARRNQEELGELTDLAQRHFAGIRVVRSLAMESFAESRFAAATRRYFTSALSLAQARSAILSMIRAVTSLNLIVTVIYGAWMLKRGEISTGGFFAFMLAWFRLLWPMANFGPSVSMLQRGRACFERLREILTAPPEIVEPAAPLFPGAPTGLRVQDLRYETAGRVIVEGVSFEVPAGRTLAIVGRVGAGKSTLAKLLIHQLPTPSGAVFVDGCDIVQLDRATLRARVGYAQQDSFLFSTTVHENVAIGLEPRVAGGTDAVDAVQRALGEAGVVDEIRALPHGVQTVVGERGVQLSGGQRQRVALARALVSSPPCLILDDPISAVDAGTEEAILSALTRRDPACTLVLVTHRVSSAARMDQILVLEDGKITQRGTHSELAARPGLYAMLAEEQRMQGELSALTTSSHAPAHVGPPQPRTGPFEASAEGGTPALVTEDLLPVGTELRLLGQLWAWMASERATLLRTLGLLIGGTALGLLRPLLIGELVGAAIAGAPLLRPASLLAALLVVTQLVGFAQSYLMQLVGARSVAAIRLRLFRFADTLGMRVFDRSPVGRMVTRIIHDVDVIGELFSSGSMNAVGDVLSLGVVLALMLALNWRLTLISLGGLPIVALAIAAMRRNSRRRFREMRTTAALMNGLLNEQVAGIAVIQAFGQEGAMAAQFDAVSRQNRRAHRRAILVETALDCTIELVQTLCVVAVLLWTTYRIGSSSAVAFVVVVTFQQYLRQFFEPIALLAQRFTILQMALAATERVLQFLDEPETEPTERLPAETPEDRSPQQASEQFRFTNVRFAYRTGEPVLHDVSLVANRGERIALVGPTGAGKSTVAQLLLRLYDTDEGQVHVFQRDVRAWPRQALRRMFSVVPQDILLFSGSILENIAMGDDRPDRERAERSLSRLGARELLLSRPNGLDARVDERGLNFSAGERQLLAIARAIYRDAPIVLLDEATASVDSRTEADIQHALEQLLHGRTALIIAHRLSTIESADRILVFRAGRIVESGRHEDLLRLNGLYARLHALQMRTARSGTSS